MTLIELAFAGTCGALALWLAIKFPHLVVAFLLTIALTTMCTGCYRRTDLVDLDKHDVLCSLGSREAYFIRPGPGDTSFLRRLPVADAMCQQAAKP